MAGEFDGFGEAARRRRWPWILLLVVLIFLAGGATMAWALLRWQGIDDFLHDRFGRPIAAQYVPSPPIRIIQQAPVPAASVGALAGQLGELSRRIATIDQRARAASGNADRAEALLVAFAGRRALDRGVGLGYIEALLRDRFGASQPQAVATIIAASRQPVTLSWLEAELDRIAPTLQSGGAIGSDWWTGLKQQLGDLIVVRRAGMPPTDTADRIDRAHRALESGQVDVALAEVARIPGNAAAENWIAAARRYIASRDALDRIETAALLGPAPAIAAPQPEPPVAAAAEPKTPQTAPELPKK